MHRRTFLAWACLSGSLSVFSPETRAADTLVVVAHPSLKGLDADAVKRIYTGRMVELDGLALRPLNLAPGTPARRTFMERVLMQTDDEFIAYWTVRRHIGKGVPPRELASGAEMAALVARTPGALGYLDAADLAPGMTVILRR